VFAFEVKNLISSALGPPCRIASAILSARTVRQPKWLSLFREEVFCQFELDGITFVAWEPFGDKRCLLDWPRTNTLGTARSIAFVRHSVGHDAGPVHLAAVEYVPWKDSQCAAIRHKVGQILRIKNFYGTSLARG
jgi:hypothetical protein